MEEELLRYQGVILCGLRKSGKTSILYQLSFILRKHPVVTIDLQKYGGSRYGAELFNDFVEQLTRLAHDFNKQGTPRFENFTSGIPAADLTAEFIKRVCVLAEILQGSDYKIPILCFLDEVERILPSSEDPRDKVEEFNAFFGSLRVLSQRERKLSLLVADVYPDCNRINHWTQKGVATNPIFNFFKEIYLSPFSEKETAEMLIDIGELMKVDFDKKTLEEIHSESGGHPFVARQLAHFIIDNICKDSNNSIKWLLSEKELKKSIFIFDRLSDYYEESIWKDLENRGFTSATKILEVMIEQGERGEWISEDELFKRLNIINSRKQYQKALNWLIEVGIIAREYLNINTIYCIKMLHFLVAVKCSKT